MEPPDRLIVPTCIGCGAMSRLGTCASTCSEHKLELVRAAAHDELVEVGRAATASLDGLSEVVEELGRLEPTPEDLKDAYRTLQAKARRTLRAAAAVRRRDVEVGEPAEAATTWWCAECGGIDAPQPCLGICVWRETEWVNRTTYEAARNRVLPVLEQERRLRGLVQRIAWATPRGGEWEQSWRALKAEACTVLGFSSGEENRIVSSRQSATTSPRAMHASLTMS